MTPPAPPRRFATSLLKALDLLTALARRPEGQTVPELVAHLRLPRTSILRMLATLEHYGLVAQDGRLWRTTERFYEWGRRETHHELQRRYHRALRAIAARVGELVELGVGEGGGVRYIDWVQADHPITVDPRKSSLYPLHRTATGKLILSQRPDLAAAVRDAHLQAEIAAAGRLGVAWNRQESDPNLVAVATWAAPPGPSAPVICVKWPFFRFTEAAAKRALVWIRRELAAG
jgi:DNA-binding IclR family transcriptional regulator